MVVYVDAALGIPPSPSLPLSLTSQPRLREIDYLVDPLLVEIETIVVELRCIVAGMRR